MHILSLQHQINFNLCLSYFNLFANYKRKKDKFDLKIQITI